MGTVRLMGTDLACGLSSNRQVVEQLGGKG